MIPAFIADRENRKRRGELDHENRVGAFSYGPDVRDQFDLYGPNDEDDEDEDDVVLECKGSSPPPQPTPMEETNAQVELERARALMEQQAAERAAAAKEAERLATIEKTRGLQSQAYNRALGYDDRQIAARGLDKGLVDQYGLSDLYTQGVDDTKLGISETDLNPMASYNMGTLFNDALNTVTGTYRGDLRKQLNALTPEGFSYDKFTDAADDSILQAILDQGRADALAQIDASKARGQLNDAGYTRALSGLDNQSASAMADLQDLGAGVLSGYRKELDALRTGELDRIGMADFSNPLSFDTYNNRLNQTVSDLGSTLKGDIFKAVGDKSFFDPSTIIGTSGAIQGFYNPTSTTSSNANNKDVANPLLDAFTDQSKNNNQNRKPSTINGVF